MRKKGFMTPPFGEIRSIDGHDDDMLGLLWKVNEIEKHRQAPSLWKNFGLHVALASVTHVALRQEGAIIRTVVSTLLRDPSLGWETKLLFKRQE